ncbi:MAG: 2-amino-4-hydroxy-6-hydroxymethyldihydropteridine diphosphokinase, partial [Bacteroidetes bacterium GWC1_47_7]
MACSIILALGSNLGDKRQNIAFALNQIEERIGSITSLSALYDTLPVGFYSTHNFVNCVCEVDTNLNISDLFSITQEIEKEMGRSNKSTNANYSDRIIDIDLIMAGNLILQTERLSIPHPLFHTRDFVLTP